eukprot:4315001-Amphidinium_carterae.1
MDHGLSQLQSLSECPRVAGIHDLFPMVASRSDSLAKPLLLGIFRQIGRCRKCVVKGAYTNSVSIYMAIVERAIFDVYILMAFALEAFILPLWCPRLQVSAWGPHYHVGAVLDRLCIGGLACCVGSRRDMLTTKTGACLWMYQEGLNVATACAPDVSLDHCFDALNSPCISTTWT